MLRKISLESLEVNNETFHYLSLNTKSKSSLFFNFILRLFYSNF